MDSETFKYFKEVDDLSINGGHKEKSGKGEFVGKFTVRWSDGNGTRK